MLVGEQFYWRNLFSIPNLLSLSRVPLGLLLFASATPSLRFSLIVLAALTDWLDGLLARRWGDASGLGAILDPMGDKTFAGCAVLVAWIEGWLTPPLMLCLLSREIALALHLILCTIRRSMGATCQWNVGTCWASKVFTTFQFILIAGLVLELALPAIIFSVLPLLAGWAFVQWWQAAGHRVSLGASVLPNG